MFGALIIIFGGIWIYKGVVPSFPRSEETMKKRDEATLTKIYKGFSGNLIPVTIDDVSYAGLIVGYNMSNLSFIVKTELPNAVATLLEGDILVMNKPDPYAYVLATPKLIDSMTYKPPF